MEEIIVLTLKCDQFADSIYPVVLKDDGNMVLIDCGYTGFLPILEQAMEEKGLVCSELTHVLLTHQDHDHMGL